MRCYGWRNAFVETTEIQFAHDGARPGLERFHVHVRCFAAWEFERTKAEGRSI